MEEETLESFPEVPEDLEIILPPEIIEELEEDSFDPDSFTAPPFVPKGKNMLTRVHVATVVIFKRCSIRDHRLGGRVCRHLTVEPTDR